MRGFGIRPFSWNDVNASGTHDTKRRIWKTYEDTWWVRIGVLRREGGTFYDQLLAVLRKLVEAEHIFRISFCQP